MLAWRLDEHLNQINKVGYMKNVNNENHQFDYRKQIIEL